MTDFTPFASIAEAYIKGQQAVKGSFVLDEGMDGNAVSEEEKSYLRILMGTGMLRVNPSATSCVNFSCQSIKLRG